MNSTNGTVPDGQPFKKAKTSSDFAAEVAPLAGSATPTVNGASIEPNPLPGLSAQVPIVPESLPHAIALQSS